jgi:hypothetical protein
MAAPPYPTGFKPIVGNDIAQKLYFYKPIKTTIAT